MNVAIIPARGGSKRIPRKNVRLFCGKPIIAYSIEAAVNAGVYDKIIVSTDDDLIADVAKNVGAEVPFLRPSDLADDHTATVPVIQHAIKELSIDEKSVVSCIYATAPFISDQDLKASVDQVRESDCAYVLPVTAYPYPIQRALRLEGGRLAMVEPDNWAVRSQDLEERFHDTGQFYSGLAKYWNEGVPLLGERSCPMVIPSYRVQDIDNEEDWIRAENLYRLLNETS